MGLQIAKWELIVGSKTQQASLQSESFSQNVPEIRDKKRGKIVCASDLSWTCNRRRTRYKMSYTYRNKLYVETIHTWISFGLFLASSKRADQTLAALFVTRASHVQFVTFFTIKNIAVHSFLTGLLLWTLCFIVTWGNHLQVNSKVKLSRVTTSRANPRLLWGGGGRFRTVFHRFLKISYKFTVHTKIK